MKFGQKRNQCPPQSVAFVDPARRSDAIKTARVICILGVIYIHAWTGLTGEELQLLRDSWQEHFRWVLMEVLGRSSVPLLGMISGWLVAGSSRTQDWTRHVSRKARTILLPMVLWNVLALLFVSGAAWLLDLAAPTPHSLGWTLQEIFVASRNPDINVQMPFLRDLFVCMAAAPLLVQLPRNALIAVALTAAACQIGDIGAPVLMRPAIAVFFALGILARRSGLADRAATLPLTWTFLPFAALVTLQLSLPLIPQLSLATWATSALDLALRISAALAFWRLSWELAASPMRKAILAIEPFAFFLFCSHLILIWLGGPLLGMLFGKLGSPLYPLYLLAQPLLVLACAVGIAKALHHTAPATARLLSGGRLSMFDRMTPATT